MRAFRPSYYAPAEDCEEEQQRAKDANVQRYAKRVEAGLPLFEGLIALGEAVSRPTDFTSRE